MEVNGNLEQKTPKKKKKTGCFLIAGWILILILLSIIVIGLIFSDKKGNETENTSPNSVEISTPTKESTIEDLVNGYNASAENKLVFVEDFVVSSKDSGHYRTEFRLNAYRDAVGKSYKLGDEDEWNVDIISSEGYFGGIDIRIYAVRITLEQCKELIQHASQLLDPTMSDATVKETIDYISEEKEANGYYYGELGLVLLGSDTKGYNLMIKTD